MDKRDNSNNNNSDDEIDDITDIILTSTIITSAGTICLLSGADPVESVLAAGTVGLLAEDISNRKKRLIVKGLFLSMLIIGYIAYRQKN